MSVSTLLSNAIATGPGATLQLHQLAANSGVMAGGGATFQATGRTTAGAGAVAVEIDVSNDGVNWLILGTITLTLSTTPATDGFVSAAPWAFVRADVKSISGTGASVSAFMGV